MTFCFCFILGVGIFSFIEIAGAKMYYLLIIVFLILFGMIFLWKNLMARLILLCLLCLLAGGARILLSLPESEIELSLFYGQEVKIVGTVADEPNIKNSRAEYILATEQPQIGRLLISSPIYPQYQYGDRLSIICRPEPPKNYPAGGFDYIKYLANQNIHAICFNPPITKIVGNAGNPIKLVLFKMKNKVGGQINELFVEPESSLLAGLLYGGRSGLSSELYNSFRLAGLSHIVAVSGYNISIISVIFLNILIILGLSRPKAFWLAMAGLMAFVIFTGASASVVRAGIMGSLVLIAVKIGRLSDAGRLLFFAAALILIINPRLLIWDVGFQLSFLATLGLIYMTPCLWKAKNKATEILFGIINPTVAAIIATAPMIMFQFGQFSLAALPANILVIWLIPWLMLFGFLSLALGWIFYPLGQIIAWLTGFGLKYVIILASWFSVQFWSAVELNISWWMMVMMYLIIIILFYFYRITQKSNVKSQNHNSKPLNWP